MVISGVLFCRFASLFLALAACSPGGDAGGASAKADDRTPPAAREVPAVPPLQADTAGRAWAERTLAGMTLRQRVAQLVFPWISGQSLEANPGEAQRIRAWVAGDGVGGLIISTGSPQATAAKLNAAQTRSGVPLLVVSDLETGPGTRLTPGGTRMPPAMAFGAADDTAFARQAGRVTAVEARAVGIHATLGPVLDVNVNPANPIINVRSFGESPEMVSRMGAAWVAGAREGGLLTIGKHFPGHGDTHADSHVGLAVVEADAARLGRVELPPFRAAIHAGMDGVLAGHIAARGVEGAGAPPASQSTRMIGGVLRGELGFQGIVFTDALNMAGATQGISVTEASIRSLLAGADALLQPPGHEGVIDGIVAAVRSGRIPAARIDEAARRVLMAKAAAGLHRGARVDASAVGAIAGRAEHRAVARSVAERSLTLARNQGGVVPLAPGSRVLHVTYTSTGRGPSGAELHRVLAAGGLAAEHVRVGPSTSATQYAALRTRASAADVVVVSVAVAPVQYRALALSPAFGAWVQGLAAGGTRVVVVSLGTPYLLQAFPAVPAYLLAWDSREPAEGAAAAALLGSVPVRGRLPVSLPPFHRLGEGVTMPQR